MAPIESRGNFNGVPGLNVVYSNWIHSLLQRVLMKKFINRQEAVVEEMLEGLVVLCPGSSRLAGYEGNDTS